MMIAVAGSEGGRAFVSVFVVWLGHLHALRSTSKVMAGSLGEGRPPQGEGCRRRWRGREGVGGLVVGLREEEGHRQRDEGLGVP